MTADNATSSSAYRNYVVPLHAFVRYCERQQRSRPPTIDTVVTFLEWRATRGKALSSGRDGDPTP